VFLSVLLNKLIYVNYSPIGARREQLYLRIEEQEKKEAVNGGFYEKNTGP